MCKSIFTGGESNPSRGWLRAKVLVGGEGLAGLAGAWAERGEHPSGARGTSCACAAERSLWRYEGRGGSACSLGEKRLPTWLRGSGLNLFRKTCFPACWRDAGLRWGPQGQSLQDLKNWRYFLARKIQKPRLGIELGSRALVCEGGEARGQ